MKKYLIALLLEITLSVNAQEFVAAENDTTVLTEYNDGRLWAYRQIGDFVVGMTNYEEKDDFGKYYQIAIFIKNLGETSVTFEPEQITSVLYSKNNDTISLNVYSYDEYMKKVKDVQVLSMALLGFSAGLNAGMAGYQTTYTTTYGANQLPEWQRDFVGDIRQLLGRFLLFVHYISVCPHKWWNKWGFFLVCDEKRSNFASDKRTKRCSKKSKNSFS